ncbi:MAG: hypothetical protein CL858_24720 [Cupriavidus sp.]|nr:hypothetical protein [Cupriavidus sp.]
MCDPILEMPERDRFGVLTGSAYQHDLFAKSKRIGIGLQGFSVDPRGGQHFYFQSASQRLADFHLKMCPYVCEIRCNYPVIDVARLQREGRQSIVYADEYAVVHRMLSLELKAKPGQIHLHGLCYHRREWQRAKALLRDTDVTLEHFDPRELPNIEVRNAMTCCQWLRGSDLHALRDHVARFAVRLGNVRNTEILDETLQRIAATLQCSVDTTYVLLAASIALGVIRIDPRYELAPRKALHLLK